MPKTVTYGEALRYIQKAGLESEANYPTQPYINGTAVCRYNASRVVVKVPKIGEITKGTEKSLEKALHVVCSSCDHKLSRAMATIHLLLSFLNHILVPLAEMVTIHAIVVFLQAPAVVAFQVGSDFELYKEYAPSCLWCIVIGM